MYTSLGFPGCFLGLEGVIVLEYPRPISDLMEEFLEAIVLISASMSCSPTGLGRPSIPEIRMFEGTV